MKSSVFISMEDFFVCPICGNDNPKYIGYIKGKPYCRKCIQFKGEEISKSNMYPKEANYELNYSLSDDQKELSNKLLINYKEGINSFVHAVCGAGKTEIVLEVIKYAINCGESVGFAIPRKDVVIELAERFRNIFNKNSVISLYGGNTDVIKGDLIVLTTHQLYRYEKYFDLLIIDEIDAFPFNGNEVLQAFFKRSVKGHYIMMSATPSKDILSMFHKEGFEVLELFSRFHMHPLPVPKLIERKSIFKIFTLIKECRRFVKENKPLFIFAPTIEICEEIFKILRIFISGGNYVHSKCINRSEIIKKFKENKYKYLVTTAILERGVTVKNLQVIVYAADHKLYTSYALIQIAGRVGRKKDAPEGEVIFIADEINKDIKESIYEIERANKHLQNMF